MKRHTPVGQKVIAVSVLVLTLLCGAYCLGEPAAETAVTFPTPTESTLPAASRATPQAQRSDLDMLEDHGYYQDPLVCQGPLPNRQAPRRSYRETEERTYSREAADTVVETILGSIITSEMSDVQKCAEVYYYIKGCISCSSTSIKSDWRQAAYWGFTTGQGDEYTFYACSRALLTALGYQVRQIQRESESLTEPHSWCLVDYGEGWYHFDPCPHLKTDPIFVCCLATDQMLANFDAGAGRDHYAFDADLYPERVGGRADPAYTIPMPKPETDNETGASPSPAATPTPTATVEPTPTPFPQESIAQPSRSPEPSARPSSSPTPTPTPTATPTATVSPAPTVSAVPSAEPTASAEPSVRSTSEPIPTSSAEPSPEPTPPPAPVPTPEEPLLPPDV